MGAERRSAQVRRPRTLASRPQQRSERRRRGRCRRRAAGHPLPLAGTPGPGSPGPAFATAPARAKGRIVAATGGGCTRCSRLIWRTSPGAIPAPGGTWSGSPRTVSERRRPHSPVPPSSPSQGEGRAEGREERTRGRRPFPTNPPPDLPPVQGGGAQIAPSPSSPSPSQGEGRGGGRRVRIRPEIRVKPGCPPLKQDQARKESRATGSPPP